MNALTHHNRITDPSDDTSSAVAYRCCDNPNMQECLRRFLTHQKLLPITALLF
jgi:hypothetical protein